MKFSSVLFVLLVLVIVLSVLIDHSEARKKDKKSKEACKYERKGEEGPCDSATNKKEVTLMLKKGDSNKCAASMPVTIACDDVSLTKKKKKDCKYEKKGSEWSECDPATNKRTKVMKLKSGSADCEPTRTKRKPCGGNKNKGSRRSKKEA